MKDNEANRLIEEHFNLDKSLTDIILEKRFGSRVDEIKGKTQTFQATADRTIDYNPWIERAEVDLVRSFLPLDELNRFQRWRFNRGGIWLTSETYFKEELAQGLVDREIVRNVGQGMKLVPELVKLRGALDYKTNSYNCGFSFEGDGGQGYIAIGNFDIGSPYSKYLNNIKNNLRDVLGFNGV